MKMSEIIELTIALVAEKDANKKMYVLLKNALIAMEHGLGVNYHRSLSGQEAEEEDYPGVRKGLSGLDILISHYKVKFLAYAGFAPKLDACGRCGGKGSRFYVSQGAVLCESCARGSDAPVEISAAMKKLYEDLLVWDTAKVQRIKPSNMLHSELSEVMSLHVKHILSKSLKTEEFIRASGKELHR